MFVSEAEVNFVFNNLEPCLNFSENLRLKLIVNFKHARNPSRDCSQLRLIKMGVGAKNPKKIEKSRSLFYLAIADMKFWTIS